MIIDIVKKHYGYDLYLIKLYLIFNKFYIFYEKNYEYIF